MSIENRVVPKPVKRRRALAALCLILPPSIRYKLLANVAINGMSALLETKNGFVDANPYAHEAARMLVEEAIVVANACGCTLEHDAEPAHAFEVARMTDRPSAPWCRTSRITVRLRSASSPALSAASAASTAFPRPATT